MALEIIKEAEQAPSGSIITDRRLYLTEDRNTVVEDGDLKAGFLLAARGHVIPGDEAKRLGLSVEDGVVVIAGQKSAKGQTPEQELAERTKRYTEEAEKQGLEGDAVTDLVSKRLKVDELVAGGMSKSKAKKEVFG